MRRDLIGQDGSSPDVLVVGGGIQGACVAWDAALRGLRVALVERDDFGAATSANSLRIVHGGLRYLARGDLRRMRESVQERSCLLRIAPGLVEPLPVLVPCGGPRLPGRASLAAAIALTHALSLGRNRAVLPSRRIPAGGLISRRACLELVPPLGSIAFSAGGLWYDARLRHPERLTLAFIRSAASRGAVVVNHAEVERFTLSGGRVAGVRVVDRTTGSRVELHPGAVVIAAGPWTGALAAMAGGGDPSGPEGAHLAVALNLVLGRRLGEAGFGIRSPAGPGEDPVGGGGRFLFLVPEGRRTLLGTWYGTASGADLPSALERGERMLLGEANRACPGLGLSSGDVLGRQWGRLPLKAGREGGRPEALAEGPRITAPGGGGPANLITVEPVKYTTARLVAERVVDRVVAILGHPPVPCRTAEVPLAGGEPAADAGTLAELIQRAIREEMALTLTDVLRRTAPGGTACLDRSEIVGTARIAGLELGWDPGRQAEEVEVALRAVGPAGNRGVAA